MALLILFRRASAIGCQLGLESVILGASIIARINRWIVGRTETILDYRRLMVSRPKIVEISVNWRNWKWASLVLIALLIHNKYYMSTYDIWQ